MSKFKKERLHQMIENALSYKQEVNTLKSNYFQRRLMGLIYRPNVYGLTFASLIISCIFIPQIVISRNFVDVNEINDFMTYEIIEEL